MSPRGSVAILTYHSLDDSGSVLSTEPWRFAEQMKILHDQPCQVVSLAEAQRALADGGPGQDLVALTFDDGFHNFAEHGLPVLRHYQFPATVFLVTDFCGKTNSWPSQPVGIEPRSLLGWRLVQEIAGSGITFGSHTRTHPDLTRLSPRSVERELRDSRLILEAALGQPVDSLAYPYGAHKAAVRRAAAGEYRLACSTGLGYCAAGSDPYGLERLDTYYLRNLHLFRELFSPRAQAYFRARRLMRDLRQEVTRRLRARKAAQC
jgi:peptidoglycan/xylan/chitin deacetylase (PgdA/CDA1 family)